MSHHKTVFFVHVPKTAGTSLRNMLLEVFIKEDDDRYNVSDRRELPDRVWQAIRDIAPLRKETTTLVMGHCPHGYGELFPNPYYITVLRDPVERVISSYFYMLQMQGTVVKDTQAESANLLEFARNPAFTNAHIKYFLDYDIQNSTVFMSAEQNADVVGRSYIGFDFGRSRAVQLRKIRIRQRRNGPESFIVQYSNDIFDKHIVDAPAYITSKSGSEFIEIDIEPGDTGTCWRVVANAPTTSLHWYVISMEMWEAKDGLLDLAVGGIYNSPRDYGLQIPSRILVTPPLGVPLSSESMPDMGPQHLFDGKNAPSLHDVDGSFLSEHHLSVAKRNLVKCSAIGLVDDLSPFLKQLEHDLGIEPIKMRRDNAGHASNKYQDLDPKIINGIKAINRLDVEFYEFGRQLSLEKLNAAGIPGYNHDAHGISEAATG